MNEGGCDVERLNGYNAEDMQDSTRGIDDSNGSSADVESEEMC